MIHLPPQPAPALQGDWYKETEAHRSKALAQKSEPRKSNTEAHGLQVEASPLSPLPVLLSIWGHVS